jgi:hypothetical protein
MREKLFFSALLIFEMYSTMSAVENLYFQNDNIPLPKEKAVKEQMRRGFGSENVGTRSKTHSDSRKASHRPIIL